jgi:ABC-type antimicrobial peptide transport system ATPase subunit
MMETENETRDVRTIKMGKEGSEKNTVARLLRAGILKPTETAVERQQLCKRTSTAALIRRM